MIRDSTKRKIMQSLESNIEKWIAENSETEEWADMEFYSHPDLVFLMARAAFQIIETCQNNQEWLAENGYMNL